MSPEIRRRFRYALAGYVILALGVAAGLYAISHHQDRLENHQNALVHELRQVNENQRAIRVNQRRIVRLTANTAAAVCLEAFAADSTQRMAIITDFNLTGKIDVSHNPTCQQAIARATSLIVGNGG